MNQMDKVRTAIRNFEQSKLDLVTAEKAFKDAGMQVETSRNELVRTLKAVCAKKAVVLAGQRYRAVERVDGELELDVTACNDIHLGAKEQTVAIAK